MAPLFTTDTVCHPRQRSAWFNLLGSGEKAKAEILFCHVYEEYAESTVIPAPSVVPIEPTPGDSHFLSGLFPTLPERSATLAVQHISETQRWFDFDGPEAPMSADIYLGGR